MHKGSAIRAELNKSLRTFCSNCKKSISTETLDVLGGNNNQTRGLVGIQNGKKLIFPTCGNCYAIGWRPIGFVFIDNEYKKPT